MFGSDSRNYVPFQHDPAFFAKYYSGPIFNVNTSCYNTNACCCDINSQLNISPEDLEEMRRMQAEKIVQAQKDQAERMAQQQKERDIANAQFENPFLDLTIVDVQ